MKKIIILIVFLHISFLLIAQIDSPLNSEVHSNSIFIEAFGNSGKTISLNYERNLKYFNKNYISSSIGFGYYSIKYWNRYNLPLTINYSFQISCNYSIDLGLGLIFQNTISKESAYNYSNVSYSTKVGLKYVGDSGLLIKIGLTPIIEPTRNTWNSVFNLWGGLSVGYSF